VNYIYINCVYYIATIAGTVEAIFYALDQQVKRMAQSEDQVKRMVRYRQHIVHGVEAKVEEGVVVTTVKQRSNAIALIVASVEAFKPLFGNSWFYACPDARANKGAVSALPDALVYAIRTDNEYARIELVYNKFKNVLDVKACVVKVILDVRGEYPVSTCLVDPLVGRVFVNTEGQARSICRVLRADTIAVPSSTRTKLSTVVRMYHCETLLGASNEDRKLTAAEIAAGEAVHYQLDYILCRDWDQHLRPWLLRPDIGWIVRGFKTAIDHSVIGTVTIDCGKLTITADALATHLTVAKTHSHFVTLQLPEPALDVWEALVKTGTSDEKRNRAANKLCDVAREFIESRAALYGLTVKPLVSDREVRKRKM
jgi:hypothetical protein